MSNNVLQCMWSIVCIVVLASFHLHAHNSFVLMTSLYNETDEKRVLEYMHCLEKNLEHPLIATVHVLYDMSADKKEPSRILNYLQSRPIAITYCAGRPTFQLFFDLANKTYPQASIILSNADIYFNETLCELDTIDLTGKLLALTRWNILPNGTLKPLYRGRRGKPNVSSQDTWIFATPYTAIKSADFGLGTMYCDGRIAYMAQEAGLNVYNPCKSIQCCHLHLTGIHHYKFVRKKNNTAQIHWCRTEDIH